jgi:hypothetical protein
MRARVWVLAAVVPRLLIVVKERRSVLRNLIGCAVLGISEGCAKRARLSINLDYAVLSLVKSELLKAVLAPSAAISGRLYSVQMPVSSRASLTKASFNRGCCSNQKTAPL